MTEYKTDYTPYLLQTQTDARGQKICDFTVPLVSLRDQFAMAALTGFLSNPVTQDITEKTIKTIWQVADIMMEARK